MELILTYDGGIHRAELADGEHLVGRSPEAALRIPVATVSSQHAHLRVDGDNLFVTELGSTNGTDLDGVALTPTQGETEIPAGSTVRFAGVPVWRAEDGDKPAPPQVDTSKQASFSDDTGLLTRSSYNIQQGYSEAAKGRIAEMLSSLFELIASDDVSAPLAEKASEFVSQWVEADRVIMLEDSGEGTQVEPTGSWSLSGAETERLRLSTTLVERVVEERTSVLIADVMGGGGSASESMVALKLRSAMAVPLFDNQRVLGILYVDTARPGVRYGDDELQVLTATANAVAIKVSEVRRKKEDATAARIQQGILPTELPEIAGFDLLARLDMCRAVGGDLYHVIQRPDGRFLIALGDVAGKGAPAALAMSACMVLLSTMAEIGGEVDEIIDLIHRKLFESLAPEQFITLFIGDLDAESGYMSYANAGHEPPILIRADGEREELPSGAPPVGLVPFFKCEVGEITLEAGDVVAIFSDGIPEATIDGEHFLGLDDVNRILLEKRAEPLESIADDIRGAVDDYLKGRHASDDVTLMLLRRQG